MTHRSLRHRYPSVGRVPVCSHNPPEVLPQQLLQDRATPAGIDMEQAHPCCHGGPKPPPTMALFPPGLIQVHCWSLAYHLRHSLYYRLQCTRGGLLQLRHPSQADPPRPQVSQPWTRRSAAQPIPACPHRRGGLQPGPEGAPGDTKGQLRLGSSATPLASAAMKRVLGHPGLHLGQLHHLVTPSLVLFRETLQSCPTVGTARRVQLHHLLYLGLKVLGAIVTPMPWLSSALAS